MRFLKTIIFVLGADSLFCWLLTSKYWVFDPITGLILLMVGLLWIGTIGFLGIEDDSR